MRLTCRNTGGIGRRAILTAAILAPAAAFAEGARLAITDLVAPDGSPTARARELAGRNVTLRGYVAPQLRPDPARVLLTEAPQSPCGLCGLTHDPGAGLAVEPATRAIVWPEFAEVSGTLDIARVSDPETGQSIELRIVAARVRSL